MKNAALSGKPYAGNPHVRFDEGEVASAKPRRGSLLYTSPVKRLSSVRRALAAGCLVVAMSLASWGEDLEWVYDTSARPPSVFSAVASEPAPDYVFETMAGHWSYISPLIRFSSFEPTGLMLLFN